MSVPNIPNVTMPIGRQDVNVAFAQVYADQQTQNATAFPSSGAAPTLALTPIPAITAYTAGQRFRVAWNVSAALPTLNVSAQGAKNIKHYDSRGNKIPSVAFANLLDDAEYDGTDHVVRASHLPRALGAYRNYKASCTGLSDSISMAADLITVRDANGGYIELASVGGTLHSNGAAGINGIDTGTSAINTWYHKYFIYNPTTNTISTIHSLSATGPSFANAAGYTHWMRMGAFKTDGSSKYPLAMQWTNARAQTLVTAAGNVVALPAICNGALGTFSATAPTWSAQSLVGFVPTTAIQVRLLVDNFWKSGALSNCLVAPNANYAGYGNASGNSCLCYLQNGTGNLATLDMVLESTSVYVASSAAGFALMCCGWEDSL